MQNYYESAPMKIGKHFWRIVVRWSIREPSIRM
jgi:hypothetical protein